MKTIWKFPLAIADELSVSMPEGAVMLTVQVQDGEPVLWAICDPSRRIVTRRFRTVGTGHQLPAYAPSPVPVQLNYVGTYQLVGDSFVGHVFEESGT